MKKNILITGGCGFIGSNFIRYLLEESDFEGKIINIDKLTYAGNLENLAGIEKNFSESYHFIRADICDKETVSKIVESREIDTICHFAAESHVDRSIVSPDQFIKTNITGTFALLEIAKEQNISFHHVSTDEVYGSLGTTGFFKENTPYGPSSPYAASKAASDHLVRAYCKTYGLSVTISNCSNNYGPYQFPEKLIPLMTLNALEEKPLPLYGNGTNVRDWLYVKDHCKAVWAIIKHGSPGEKYNIGGRSEKKNIDVVKKICNILDDIKPLTGNKPHADLIVFVEDRPGHDWRYAIDCSKIEKELGWSPDESFETGIRKTVNWYLEYKEWVNNVRSGEYRKRVKAQTLT